MVLQRWQTVYLFISVIAMALAAAFPAVEPLRVAQPVVELGGAVLVARVLAAAIAVFCRRSALVGGNCRCGWRIFYGGC